MRILVTVQPQMYREVLALALHRHRPDAEILLSSLEFPDVRVESLQPNLVVRNETDGVNMELYGGVLCWVEILYSDGMDARISLDGEVREIEDIRMNELLALVDEVEQLISPGPASGRRCPQRSPGTLS